MPSDKSDRPEELRRIQDLHEIDWSASKARDLKTLRSLWTDDCVVLAPGQPPIVGDEAMWAYMQSQNGSDDLEILEYYHIFEEINILGDWAYEWGTFHGVYRICTDGEILKEQSRLMRILRRQPEGNWKVARVIWQAMPEKSK